jgi:hypothetical protein
MCGAGVPGRANDGHGPHLAAARVGHHRALQAGPRLHPHHALHGGGGHSGRQDRYHGQGNSPPETERSAPACCWRAAADYSSICGQAAKAGTRELVEEGETEHLVPPV